jgi:hypothetical protein
VYFYIILSINYKITVGNRGSVENKIRVGNKQSLLMLRNLFSLRWEVMAVRQGFLAYCTRLYNIQFSVGQRNNASFYFLQLI